MQADDGAGRDDVPARDARGVALGARLAAQVAYARRAVEHAAAAQREADASLRLCRDAALRAHHAVARARAARDRLAGTSPPGDGDP